MAAIPWKIIISATPALIDAAGRLFKKADAPPASLQISPSTNGEEKMEAVVKRLEYFESLEADQAKLLKQTIEQLQNISVSSANLALRANVAIALSAVTLVALIATVITR